MSNLYKATWKPVPSFNSVNLIPYTKPVAPPLPNTSTSIKDDILAAYNLATVAGDANKAAKTKREAVRALYLRSKDMFLTVVAELPQKVQVWIMKVIKTPKPVVEDEKLAKVFSTNVAKMIEYLRLNGYTITPPTPEQAHANESVRTER